MNTWPLAYSKNEKKNNFDSSRKGRREASSNKATWVEKKVLSFECFLTRLGRSVNWLLASVSPTAFPQRP